MELGDRRDSREEEKRIEDDIQTKEEDNVVNFKGVCAYFYRLLRRS